MPASESALVNEKWLSLRTQPLRFLGPADCKRSPIHRDFYISDAATPSTVPTTTTGKKQYRNKFEIRQFYTRAAAGGSCGKIGATDPFRTLVIAPYPTECETSKTIPEDSANP